MSTEPVVRLSDVSFAYGDRLTLDHVNLSIAEREFVWVVGPNGGGKTTLVKLLLGLLRPDEGQVHVFGSPPRQVLTRIGYMPQQVSLDPHFPIDVLSVVLMGRLRSGFHLGPFNQADKDAAYRALSMVELDGMEKRPFAQLSGGQQRRLLIARALAGGPDLLILDEPTANVDPAVQKRLLELTRRLSEQMTVVMVSHDPAFVLSGVEQVVCVKQQVHVHPTTELTGDMLGELYGDTAMRIVRHDRHVEGEGHV
ncbi:MAG: ABC transporter ATP-binding protein [bacterium]